MDLLVREATSEDAALIAGLTRDCWAGEAAPGTRAQDDQGDLVATVTQHLQRGGGFILQDGQQAIGSVRWLPLETEDGVWEISLLGVLPAWRGNQLSQHLLEAVVHHAHASNVDELRLAVPAEQARLVDLYAAQGFELAMELDVEHTNPLERAPNVMRRMLRR